MQTADLRLQELLEGDRVWNAYALADLRPPWREHTRWITGDRSAVMVFAGLSPPILFACGDPVELDRLYEQLPPGDYWFTLRPTDYSRLAPRLVARQRVRMWRMWLPTVQPGNRPRDGVVSTDSAAGIAPDQPSAGPGTGEHLVNGSPSSPPQAHDFGPRPERLGDRDLPAIKRLYAGLPESPDAFHPSQLTHGVYFGIRGAQGLLSVAGTHVLSTKLGVAALGNIATAPEQRGRGMARLVARAVIAELRRLQIETIVLNVRMDNHPATQLYRRLGFMPYCGFYEGRGRIQTIN